MVSKIIKIIYLLMALMILGSFVMAAVSTTTVSWVVPSNISHSVAYGSTCSSSLFYFVETDGTINGDENKIVPKTSVVGDANCQSDSIAGMTVTNNGSVTIDMNYMITDSLLSGVRFVTWYGSTGCGTFGLGGWEDVCTKTGADDLTVPTTIACVSIGDANVQIIADLTSGISQQLCFAADFENVAAGTNTNNLEADSITSAG